MTTESEILEKINADPSLATIRPTIKGRMVEVYKALEAHVSAVSRTDLVSSWKSNSRSDRKATRESVLEKLDYSPDTGQFLWKVGSRAGDVAGHLATERNKTYIRIRVNGELIMAHLLAWLVLYGEFPSFEIDHENGDGTDNRKDNLVRSNRLLNNRNARQRSDTKAEFRNISKLTNSNKYALMVKYAKKHFTVGGFDTEDVAAKARDLLEELVPKGVSHHAPKL